MAEFDGCGKCAYVREDEYGKHCRKCIHNCSDQFEKATNADGIRNLTDKKLAEFLDAVSNDLLDFGFPCEHCTEKTECDKCFLTWLQSENEVEHALN